MAKPEIDPGDVMIEFTSPHYSVVPDPGDLCRHVFGTIKAYIDGVPGPPDDEQDPTPIGTISLLDVRLDLSDEHGMTPFSVLDDHSQDAAEYCLLLAGMDGEDDDHDLTWWRPSVQEKFDCGAGSLLIIDDVQIEEPYRGQGVGLMAVHHAIEIYERFCGLTAIIPFPPQFQGCLGQNFNPPPGVKAEDIEAEFKAAEAKLARYWSRLGFKRAADTRIFALGANRQRPSLEDVLDHLHDPPPPLEPTTRPGWLPDRGGRCAHRARAARRQTK